MRLDELTSLEYAWLGRMASVRGSMEERHETYSELGIYDAWRDIFDRYVALALQNNIEALKRAVFLRWYECSEPSWLNGLFELSNGSAKRLGNSLEACLARNPEDDEFVWMLPYYYSLTDFYLGPMPDSSKLWEWSGLGDANLWRQRLDHHAMRQRGHLGEYWRSIRKDA